MPGLTVQTLENPSIVNEREPEPEQNYIQQIISNDYQIKVNDGQKKFTPLTISYAHRTSDFNIRRVTHIETTLPSVNVSQK